VRPSYSATFSNDPKNLYLARNAIAAFADLCGFDDDAIAEIKLAAGEALSNAAEYGRSHRGGRFDVHCTFDDQELLIEVQDSGEGFAEPPDTTSVAPDDRNRGFGIFIMRNLMDSVTFARNGTRVRMIRKRSGDPPPGLADTR
jgi:anti-sigma regulatory factor (Ser/Thr protein kinase)